MNIYVTYLQLHEIGINILIFIADDQGSELVGGRAGIWTIFISFTNHIFVYHHHKQKGYTHIT